MQKSPVQHSASMVTLVEVFGEPRTSEPVDPEPLNAYNKKGTFITESAFAFLNDVSVYW